MFGAILAGVILGQSFMYQVFPESLVREMQNTTASNPTAFGVPYGAQYPTLEYQYPFNYQPYPMFGYSYPYYTPVPYIRPGYGVGYGHRGGLR